MSAALSKMNFVCCKKDTRLGTGLTDKDVLAKIILYVYTVFIPELIGT